MSTVEDCQMQLLLTCSLNISVFFFTSNIRARVQLTFKLFIANNISSQLYCLMYNVLSKAVSNTAQGLTFGYIPICVFCRMSHYIDHFSITTQAVFFQKCNYGNFTLHYISQNVIQLLIWITTPYLYRIDEKLTKTFCCHIIIQSFME